MRIFLGTLLVLISQQAAFGADDPAWLKIALKKDDPNQLAYWVGVEDDCPVSQEDAVAIIEGVFIRSRIKPLAAALFSDPLYLYVAAQCMSLESDNPVFATKVGFGKYNTDVPIKYDHDFGAIGIGDADLMKKALKEGVERAITTYLKVNFDLGE